MGQCSQCSNSQTPELGGIAQIEHIFSPFITRQCESRLPGHLEKSKQGVEISSEFKV